MALLGDEGVATSRHHADERKKMSLFLLRPSRGYPLRKIQENNEAEIMGVVCDEARESYQSGIVVELESNTMEDLEENVARIVAWIDQWLKDSRGMDDDGAGSE